MSRRRQGLVPQPSQSEPPKSHPTSNDEQEEPDSTAPAPPVNPDDTDEQRLEHAQTLYQNRQSAAYACYAAPRLSDQLDKSKRRMIAWECKTCLGDINRPANDRSCSNLLTHAGRCKLKQSKAAKNKTLGLVGILGTGEIDPREVLQQCVIWCAEGANPFSALQEDSLKRLMHPTIVKNLPNRKMMRTRSTSSIEERQTRFKKRTYHSSTALQRHKRIQRLEKITTTLLQNRSR
ncbi:hypothetical protein PSTG_11441 [Puccinia striiformis f. sp. tritici PST-78]|uniref:BED-type domain-containing protein n=1 Tax=Puccinia striiformis f. sp. tritici PST-78 TaxID=1165861 RepID=A0A0L0V8E4_9BASI|nr:hypothetical protein PSTG_11441 [Puccinia striiformis f. sp. tritici PST-78]